MALDKVVDEHSTALEAQLAIVALEDKLLVVRRRCLRHKPGIAARFRQASTSSRFVDGSISRRMNSPHMIAQFVLQ